MPVLDGHTGLPQRTVASADMEGLVSLFNTTSDLGYHMQVMFALRCVDFRVEGLRVEGLRVEG